MPKYKLGDRVRTKDNLHGHDARTIFGTIGAMESDEFGDTTYRIDWDEGGCDWLYAGEFELVRNFVYLAQVQWDIRTHNAHMSGHAIVGVYHSMNIDTIVGKMVCKVEDMTGIHIQREHIRMLETTEGAEVTYAVGSSNIIGFIWKQTVEAEKSILRNNEINSCLYGAPTYQDALKQMHRRILRKYQCSHPELLELTRVGANKRQSKRRYEL